LCTQRESNQREMYPQRRGLQASLPANSARAGRGLMTAHPCAGIRRARISAGSPTGFSVRPSPRLTGPRVKRRAPARSGNGTAKPSKASFSRVSQMTSMQRRLAALLFPLGFCGHDARRFTRGPVCGGGRWSEKPVGDARGIARRLMPAHGCAVIGPRPPHADPQGRMPGGRRFRGVLLRWFLSLGQARERDSLAAGEWLSTAKLVKLLIDAFLAAGEPSRTRKAKQHQTSGVRSTQPMTQHPSPRDQTTAAPRSA